jgi:hypothetical protein
MFRSAFGTEVGKMPLNNDTYASNIVTNLQSIGTLSNQSVETLCFSPHKINNKDKFYVFSKVESLDEARIQKLVTANTIEDKRKFAKNISVRIVTDNKQQTTPQDKIFNNPKFSGADDQNRRDILRKKVTEQIIDKIRLESQNNKTQNLNLLEQSDVTTQNNIFDNKTPQEYGRIPRQHKYLTNLDEEARRALMIDTPYSRDLGFFNLKKIMIFDGYDTDKQGNIIVGSPKMRVMQNSDLVNLTGPIMCKMVNYEDPSLNVDNTFKDFGTANSIFVISPTAKMSTNASTAPRLRHRRVLAGVLNSYNSSNLYENQFLRTTVNKEHRTRRKSLPRKSRRKNTAMSRTLRNRAIREESRKVMQKMDKMAIEQEKRNIMESKAENTNAERRSDIILARERLDTTRTIEAAMPDAAGSEGTDSKPSTTQSSSRNDRRRQRRSGAPSGGATPMTSTGVRSRGGGY